MHKANQSQLNENNSRENNAGIVQRSKTMHMITCSAGLVLERVSVIPEYHAGCCKLVDCLDVVAKTFLNVFLELGRILTHER